MSAAIPRTSALNSPPYAPFARGGEFGSPYHQDKYGSFRAAGTLPPQPRHEEVIPPETGRSGDLARMKLRSPATVNATLQVASVAQLARVLTRLETVKDVFSVQRALS